MLIAQTILRPKTHTLQITHDPAVDSADYVYIM